MADIVNHTSLSPMSSGTHAGGVKATNELNRRATPSRASATAETHSRMPSGEDLSEHTDGTPPTRPLLPGQRAGGRRRQMAKAVAGISLVAVWLVLGFALSFGPVNLLLLGISMIAAYQTTVRRRPLRELLDRDTATFAQRWPGKLLVGAIVVLIPASMLAVSVSGDRYGSYADDSWKA